MISSATSLANTSAASRTTGATGKGYSELDQSDFFRLLTVQIQQQDPLDPVDNKEMLAQMAQFSSLSGINDVNATLKAMSGKLDKLIDAGTPAAGATKPATTTTPATKEA